MSILIIYGENNPDQKSDFFQKSESNLLGNKFYMSIKSITKNY